MSERRIYMGRPAALVEVETVDRVVRTRRYIEARWRFVGLHRGWFHSRNVFRALLDAAHACRMSGRSADWRPIKP